MVEGRQAKTTSATHYTNSIDDKLLGGKYTEEELETLYMGTPSEARKRFQRSRLFQRRQPFNQRRSFSPDSNFLPRRSRFDGRERRDRSQTPVLLSPQDFPRCIACKCKSCSQNKTTCEEIKKLIF